jgi:hypothetical protein
VPKAKLLFLHALKGRHPLLFHNLHAAPKQAE